MARATVAVSKVAVARYNRDVRILRTAIADVMKMFENMPKYEQAAERLQAIVKGFPPKL